MKSKTPLLFAAVLLCATLTFSWVRLSRENRELAADLRALEAADLALAQQTRELEQTTPIAADESVRARPAAAIVLTPAQRARPAVGAFVARLKEAHAKLPPPPKRPPPPVSASGREFPELMSDPIYNRCVSIWIRSWFERDDLPRLRKLGLSEETADKVIGLLTDRYMARRDEVSILGSIDVKAPILKIWGEIDAQIRALMGPEAFNQFAPNITTGYGAGSARWVVTERGIQDGPQSVLMNVRLATLERRLSYSSEPLTEAQKNALTTVLRDLPIQTSPWQNTEFLQSARAHLSIQQQAAIEELNLESAAYVERRKLPK